MNSIPFFYNQDSDIFTGYSNTPLTRERGSSGGTATEILEFLLSEKKVDAVIGAGFTDTDRTLPAYKLISDPDRIHELSGSKYTYMPLAPLLELAACHSPQRLAIVAQPCFARPLRIKFPGLGCLISFFCGYNMNTAATHYLINRSGILPQDIDSIEYRGGPYPGGFSIHVRNGTQKNFGKEYYELLNLMFLHPNCRNCRIYINQDADIVLGDAWIKNAPRQNIILTNTLKGRGIIQTMYHKNRLTLYDLAPADLLRMHQHNINGKMQGRSRFIRLLLKLFNNPIARRLAPFHLIGFLSRIRRKFAIGISVELRKTTRLNT